MQHITYTNTIDDDMVLPSNGGGTREINEQRHSFNKKSHLKNIKRSW